MGILTLEDFASAKKRKIRFRKNSVTANSARFQNLMAATGNFPNNTANNLFGTDFEGGVPIGGYAGTPGYVNLWGEDDPTKCFYDPLTEQAYITGITAIASVPCLVRLWDHLAWLQSTVETTSNLLHNWDTYETSIAPRLCGDPGGLELWESRMHATTVSTATPAEISYSYGPYLDGDIISRNIATGYARHEMNPEPLNTGIHGLAHLSQLFGNTSGAGNFDFSLLRPLLSYRIWEAYKPVRINFLAGGGIPIHNLCALLVAVRVDSGTASGIHDLTIDLAAA